MVIGYARVSTTDQNEERQIKALMEKGIAKENIFIDKMSGKDANRPELKRMQEYIRKGDTVIVESISRLARSTKDLLSIVDLFQKKEVEFISMKENIDTSTPAGKFMLTVFAALSELERENILLRQSEGIAIAKQQGKYKGRKAINIDEKQFQNVCKEWKSGNITATQAMKELNLKPNTFYRRVKQLGV